MSVHQLAHVLQFLVGLSGVGCVVAELVRSRPVNESWWRYLLHINGREWEWQLYLSGLALIFVAGLALNYSSLILLAALPLYAWLYFYLAKHPYGRAQTDQVAWRPSTQPQSHVTIRAKPSEEGRS